MRPRARRGLSKSEQSAYRSAHRRGGCVRICKCSRATPFDHHGVSISQVASGAAHELAISMLILKLLQNRRTSQPGDISMCRRLVVVIACSDCITNRRHVVGTQIKPHPFAGYSTGVSHPYWSSSSPSMMPKNCCWIAWVTGPRLPSPTGKRSTERIGVISAAVPVKNTSSAR